MKYTLTLDQMEEVFRSRDELATIEIPEPKRGVGYPFGEKPKGYPAKISRHISKNDWCHLCGQRVDLSADIWYPNNAEAVVRDGEDAPGPGHYVRICQGCACIIQDAISHVGK